MQALLTLTTNVLACGLQELSSPAAAVEKSRTDGVPTAWRLFAFGPFSITKDGQTVAGNFLPEHADAIMAHSERKGNQIPLDSEHGLAMLADKLSVDESELLPLLNRSKVTMGYGALQIRDDGLWLTGVKWVPLARKIMAEGVLRWFSPVLRGLVHGRLRITSVALTNTPALDNLDAIAASAETDDEPLVPRTPTPPAQKGTRPPMKELIAKLAKAAGIPDADAAVLTADTAEATLLPKLVAIIGTNATHSALLADLRGALALSAESAPEAVKGAVLALVEKSKTDTASLSAITTRVQALETERNTKERQTLIDGALASGKLTPALVEAWAKNQDVAVLSQFLAAVPVIVPPGRTIAKTDLPNTDTVALSAEDTAVAELLGITPAAMTAAKKAQQPAA